MLKLTVIISCSLLIFSTSLVGKEEAPKAEPEQKKEENSKEPKVVIDGKLDEFKDTLLEILKDVDYEPFHIPKDSRVMYDFEKDWVQWVMDNAFSQFGKMTPQDEKFVRTALHMTIGGRFRGGFHPQAGHTWQFVMNGIKVRDKTNSHTLPTLVASMGIIFSKEHINKIKQHKDYDKLGDLGKFLTIRGYSTAEQANLMIAILANDKLNTEKNSEFIRHEVMRVYLARRNKNKVKKLSTHPKLAETIKHTIIGHQQIDAAWKIRGNAFAHKVPRENMEAFRDGLIDAKNSLIRAWALDKKNIHAVRQLMTVNMADGQGELRMWLDRGLAIYMDDRELLDKYSYAMEPKWSGSVPELLGIVVAASMTDREGSRLPIFANRTLHKLNNLVESDLLENPLFTWLVLENAKKMLNTEFSACKTFLIDFILVAEEHKRLDLLMPYYDRIITEKVGLRLKKPLIDKIELQKLGVMDMIDKARILNDQGKYSDVVSLYNISLKKWPRIKENPELFRDFLAGAQCNLWIKSKPNTKVPLPIDDPLLDCREHLVDPQKAGFDLGFYDIDAYEEYSMNMYFTLARGVTLLKSTGKPVNAGVILGLKASEGAGFPFEFVSCNLELISDGKAILRIMKNFDEFKVINVDTVKIPKGDKIGKANLTVHVKSNKLSVSVNGKEFVKDLKFEELKPIKGENGVNLYGKTGYFSLPEKKALLPKDLKVDFTLIK